MKKLLVLLFLTSAIFCPEDEKPVIANYDATLHEKAVTEIFFQNQKYLFEDSDLLDQSTPQEIEKSHKHDVKCFLANPEYKHKVLTRSGDIAGFISFSIKKGQRVKSKIKSKSSLWLHALAVSKEYQRQGLGRMLINEAIAQGKKYKPSPAIAKLNVMAKNNAAQALYNAEGFTVSKVQPRNPYALVQYEKNIEND